MYVNLRHYLLFLLVLGVSWTTSVHAQSSCPRNDFSRINSECMAASSADYKALQIPLAASLKGNIYFYKTANGELGKLKVIYATVSNKECTAYIDASTYNKQSVFVPNSSISIGVDKNHWLKTQIYLDREGYSALELSRLKGVCTLTLTKDTGIAFFHKQSEEKIFKEENNLLFMAPLALIFVAIFLVARSVLEEQDRYKTQETLEEAESTKVKDKYFILKVTKPFYKRYFLPIAQGMKNKQKFKTAYRQKLANAGLTKDLTPEEFFALKLFMILGMPFLFLCVRWFLEATWPISLTPLMGVVGFYYPNMWVNGLIDNRKAEILRGMPFIVDMLALSVEAGLDFMAAIQRVIEKAPPGPLVEEFEILIRETRIGSSRAEGLRQLSWRVNVIEINSFCATLIAADSVGASIGPILKQLSAELRVKRSARAESLGAQAATKILIPMIFFILPAVIIAIFAPMGLKFIAGD